MASNVCFTPAAYFLIKEKGFYFVETPTTTVGPFKRKRQAKSWIKRFVKNSQKEKRTVISAYDKDGNWLYTNH